MGPPLQADLSSLTACPGFRGLRSIAKYGCHSKPLLPLSFLERNETPKTRAESIGGVMIREFREVES